MNAKVRCVGKIPSILEYVRIVKSHSNLSLREAKEFCERTRDLQGIEFILVLKTSLSEFQNDLKTKVGDAIFVSNLERERQLKLLSLGLGDKSDMIVVLSEEFASELLRHVREHKEVTLFSIFKEHMSDILCKFTSEQLDDIYNRKIANPKNNIYES